MRDKWSTNTESAIRNVFAVTGCGSIGDYCDRFIKPAQLAFGYTII